MCNAVWGRETALHFCGCFGGSSDYERGDNRGFQKGQSDGMDAEDKWD